VVKGNDQMTRKAKRPEGEPAVPEAARLVCDDIVGLTDAFSQEHLRVEGVSMAKALVAAFSCLVLLLLAGPLPADQEDLNTELMRATVKITHDKSTGTGFFLWRPDLRDPQRSQFVLVTAAHVFENILGDEATLYLRKRESEGVYKKVPMKLLIRADGKPRWTRHPSEDVAVLVVEPSKEADLPRLPPDLLATDEALKKYGIHPGDTLSYLGYPHRVEANGAGFPILRTGPVASFPLTPAKANKTFLLSTNPFEGEAEARSTWPTRKAACRVRTSRSRCC